MIKFTCQIENYFEILMKNFPGKTFSLVSEKNVRGKTEKRMI
jgi:hypothetical protein